MFVEYHQVWMKWSCELCTRKNKKAVFYGLLFIPRVVNTSLLYRTLLAAPPRGRTRHMEVNKWRGNATFLKQVVSRIHGLGLENLSTI